MALLTSVRVVFHRYRLTLAKEEIRCFSTYKLYEETELCFPIAEQNIPLTMSSQVNKKKRFNYLCAVSTP